VGHDLIDCTSLNNTFKMKDIKLELRIETNPESKQGHAVIALT